MTGRLEKIEPTDSSFECDGVVKIPALSLEPASSFGRVQVVKKPETKPDGVQDYVLEVFVSVEGGAFKRLQPELFSSELLGWLEWLEFEINFPTKGHFDPRWETDEFPPLEKDVT